MNHSLAAVMNRRPRPAPTALVSATGFSTGADTRDLRCTTRFVGSSKRRIRTGRTPPGRRVVYTRLVANSRAEMRVQVAICLWLVPTVSLAQQNQPPPQPYPQPQQQQPVSPGYPPPQQQPYPYGYPPQQQQYPYQYPPQPQQYPYGYPPPQGYQQPQTYQQPQPQPPPQGFPPAAATGEPQSPYGAQAVKLQRLQLATASEAA